MLLGQLSRHLGKKIKLDTYFTPCPKQTPNIRNLNVKNIYTIQVLEANMGEFLYNLG